MFVSVDEGMFIVEKRPRNAETWPTSSDSGSMPADLFEEGLYTPFSRSWALGAGRWTLERQLTKPAYHRHTQVMRFVHVAVAAFCCAK
jgi:hypothetical protein